MNATLKRSADLFDEVAKRTEGYLGAKRYGMVYECSLNAQEGLILDVGPAQGGSSIALGLGIKDSGRKDSLVCSIERGIESDALKSMKDIDLNRRVLEENIAAYGASESSLILMGAVEDVATQVPDDRPIAGAFIDADGAIDRELSLFYNRMLPGAFLVIDDYRDTLDEDYLIKSEEKLERLFKTRASQGKRGDSPLAGSLLGKCLTCYCLVNDAVNQGLIEEENVIRGTFFGRKPSTITGEVDFDPSRWGDIRRDLYEQFLVLRERYQSAKKTFDFAIGQKTAAEKGSYSSIQAPMLRRPGIDMLGDRRDVINSIPNQAGYNVGAVLYQLGRLHSGRGAVVELGSRYGGNCAYVGQGLADVGSSSEIHCFDRFSKLARESDFQLDEGSQDYGEILQQAVRPHYGHVITHDKSERHISWDGSDIELFVDNWSDEISNFSRFMHTFGPSFVPGLTVMAILRLNRHLKFSRDQPEYDVCFSLVNFFKQYPEHFKRLYSDQPKSSAMVFRYEKAFDFKAELEAVPL